MGLLSKASPRLTHPTIDKIFLSPQVRESQQGEQLLKELIETNQAQEEYNIKRKGVTVDRQTIYRHLYDSVNRINRVGQMIFKDDAAVSFRLMRI